MKRIFIIFILILEIFVPTLAETSLPAEKGIVTNIEYSDSKSVTGGTDNDQVKQQVTIKITTGKFKGQEISIDNMLTSNPAYDIILTKGDKVILHLEPKTEFIDDIDDINFFISDIARTDTIYFLVAIFFGLLLFIGRKKGVFSFISIIATVCLIFYALTPMILNGISPIISALIISIISTVITIYLVGGFNYKSSAAILGTISSLALAAILSLATIKFATLTGFDEEEAMFLYTTRPDLDFTGILSASMLLASLGAIMDIGVSIASTINEIHETKNDLSVKELFTSGMNVGKDIIGTMSNTLILVYLGSALPLVLLSNNIDLTKFFNLNEVVTEISSALIGSIAILACVPITAIISAYFIKFRKKEDFEFKA